MPFVHLYERTSKLPDPRQSAKCTHILGEVVFMTIVGQLCGADDWNGIATCARLKEDWLRLHLKLPGGIPSHDTFNRIYQLIDPAAFRELFTNWVKDTLIDTPLSGVIAIDGKTVRGSRSKLGSAIHMVNAWSTEAGISLGQYKVDGKSNEITAVPELLDMLSIEGCLVTADAMSCQKRIVTKVLKAKADFLLAVKNNQKKLYGELDRHFINHWESTTTDEPNTAFFSEQKDAKHGRAEHRRCWVLHDLSACPVASKWEAKTIAAVQLDRRKGNKGKSLIRYFICSKVMTAAEILQATRLHWQVENSLHWVLDVAFSEDKSRARAGNAAENLAVVRQIALNLLKKDTTLKVGIKNKRHACGWNNDYLAHVLGLDK